MTDRATILNMISGSSREDIFNVIPFGGSISFEILAQRLPRIHPVRILKSLAKLEDMGFVLVESLGQDRYICHDVSNSSEFVQVRKLFVEQVAKQQDIDKMKTNRRNILKSIRGQYV